MIADAVKSLGTEPPRTGLGGKDLDDTPEMVKLTAETDKLNSINPASPTNWSLVEQCSRIILQDYAKQFLVAAYYGVSQIKLQGNLDAVSAGAAVFQGIIASHWQDALPPAKRKKGRWNSLQFWIDQAYEFVDGYSGEPAPASSLSECQEILKELDSAVAEVDENDGPNVRPLLSALRNFPVVDDTPPPEPASPWAASVKPAERPAGNDAPAAAPAPAEATPDPAPAKAPEPAPAAPAASAATAPAPAPAPKAPPPPLEIPQAEGADQKAKVAFRFLSEAAEELTKADLFSPEGLIYRRMGAWLKIRSLPANDRGLTRLPAPADEIRTAIEKLYISGEYEKLARQCENRMPQHLFWLDLSFYTAHAAAKLGHPEAADAVRNATAFLVARVPGIDTLKFDNGSPMCSQDTRGWMATFGSNNESGSTNKDPAKAKITEALLASGTDLGAAARILGEAVRGSAGIDRLRYEAALAYCFAGAGRKDLSTGLIARVLERIRNDALASWFPEATAEILGSAFDVYRKAGMLPEATAVLVELSEISPETAMTRKYTED